MKINTTALVTLVLISAQTFAATEFNMTFSTAAPGGNYAQKNVVVAWVTQADGTFVKTILRYANAEKSLLSTWRAVAGTSDADAVLGATRANHSAPVTMTATWDLKDKSGVVVPDGTYRINFEMTDGSRVAHSFNFVKDTTAGMRTDPGTAYFKNISIAYAPPAPPNTAPVAHALSLTNVVEDTAKSITLTATDAETNALTYAIVTGPSHGTLSGTPPSVTYTPAANYYGADSFTFQASDASLSSAPATVSITVTPVNDPPVAQNQSVSVARDLARAIILAAMDVEKNALTYAIMTGPSHGELSGILPNVIYTPATNYTGLDSFTFRASDSVSTGNTATVSITVAVNVVPVADNQSVSTVKNTAKAITLAATDAETNALAYVIETGPAHGELSGIAPNVTYTPATNYTGPDSFTFSAFDGFSTGNVATVSITVTDIQYVLAVNSGNGGGAYTNGAQVIITANDPAIGKVFNRWTGSTQYVTSVTSSPTTVTMPAQAATLTATYKMAYYALTIIGGTGGGSYTNGQRVTIKATVPVGWKFDRWTSATQYMASVTSSPTVVTMPANAVICTASFKDIQKPVLTVSSPATGVRLTNALVTVTGKATDNSGSADVLIRLNAGDWTTNNVLLGTTNWTAGLTLQPGTNVFRAYARDATGNNSLTSSVVYTYVVYGALTIQTNGLGTVTRLPAGVPEVGKIYTLTATPKVGYVFSNWTGDAVINPTNKVATFRMDSNSTFTANFTDIQKPTVKITAPTASLRILGTNGLYTVRGTAADNLALSNVLVQLNGGSWIDAATTNNWKNWSLPVMLIEKTNTIRACSLDTTGNNSLTSTVTCIYVPTARLMIQTNGLGTVTRTPVGEPEVGKTYTLTATPKVGSAFSGWTGDTVSNPTSKVAAITITSNKTVAANFIDIQKPTVVITYPTASMRVMTNGTVVLRGTAADNGALKEVNYQLHTGEWTNAVTTNVWKNWTANFYPVSGLNTVRVYSVDTQGNVSSTSTVVFNYAPGALMQVQTNGAGTITPSYNGKVLEIGKSYTMTAAAKTGVSVFTNWTDGTGVVTNKAAVTFVMQSNLVLTANFRSLLAMVAMANIAVAAPATPQAMIMVDGSATDWANIPCSSFSYASVTQEVAVALAGNNIALLLKGCPFGTSDTVLVYFKLRLSYGVGDNRHSVDLWTSSSVLYGMVDGQVIAGLEAVLLDGVLEVKLPVDQAPSQVTIEEIGCGMDPGTGTLTELFKLTLP